MCVHTFWLSLIYTVCFHASSVCVFNYTLCACPGSGMNLMNIRTKKWESDLSQMAGGPELELKLGLEPVPTKTQVGLVSHYLSKRYGFSPSCAVTAFMGDNPATLAGTRAQPGDVVVCCHGDGRATVGPLCHAMQVYKVVVKRESECLLLLHFLWCLSLFYFLWCSCSTSCGVYAVSRRE